MMHKYPSEHYDNIETLWDQNTWENRDEWDEWYVNNLSFNYSIDYNRTAAITTSEGYLAPYENYERDP